MINENILDIIKVVFFLINITYQMKKKQPYSYTFTLWISQNIFHTHTGTHTVSIVWISKSFTLQSELNKPFTNGIT